MERGESDRRIDRTESDCLEAVRVALRLVVRVDKLSCFSPEYDLETCPHRGAVPVGITRWVEDGEMVEFRGVLVGGVPVGEEGYARADFSVAGCCAWLSLMMQHAERGR